jgi:hypothetical protein
MCARRFLLIMFVLTLLAVGAAFAIFQFGQRMLIAQAVPKGHFEAPRDGRPDYAGNDAWLIRPGQHWPDDPTQWKPSGAPPPPSGERPADLFYIHPTTYLERDRWNAPLRPQRGYTDARTRLFLQGQASAFTDVARPWAPRYRQAAYGAFLLKSEDAQQALDLAYGDVLAAFDRFLEEKPGDRPIILAGHSQGALHLSRLLADRSSALRARLVAAYVVGWPLSVTADLPAMGLPACTRPDQAGCVLSWQSFAEPANPALVLDSWQGTTGPTGLERRRDDMLCVNPLTGSRDGAALPGANPGTLVPTADLADATLEPGRVGARCERGFLVIYGDIPPLGPYVLPGNNYHVYDFALFWAAVRRDAVRRMAAWRR